MKFFPSRIKSGTPGPAGIPGPIGSPGKPGSNLRYLEFKIRDFYFDDVDSGVNESVNILWGVLPCLEFDATVDGTIWVAGKAPEYFDYNKPVYVTFLYNLGSESSGNVYIQGSSYVIEDNSYTSEMTPVSTGNLTIAANSSNTGNLDEITFPAMTITSTDIVNKPLYFSFSLKRIASNVADTYTGKFQFVSMVIYQLETDFESIEQNDPTQVGYYGSMYATDGTYFYLFGGYNAGNTPAYTNSFKRYSLAGGWETLATGPAGGYNGACAYINGKIYITSYYGGNMNYYKTWAYTISTNTWEDLNDGPILRSNVGCTVHNGIMYVGGGWYYSGFNNLYSYNPVSNVWALRGGTENGRNIPVMFGDSSNNIYMYGGSAYGTSYNYVVKWDGSAWTTHTPNISLPTAATNVVAKHNNIAFWRGDDSNLWKFNDGIFSNEGPIDPYVAMWILNGKLYAYSKWTGSTYDGLIYLIRDI